MPHSLCAAAFIAAVSLQPRAGGFHVESGLQRAWIPASWSRASPARPRPAQGPPRAVPPRCGLLACPQPASRGTATLPSAACCAHSLWAPGPCTPSPVVSRICSFTGEVRSWHLAFRPPCRSRPGQQQGPGFGPGQAQRPQRLSPVWSRCRHFPAVLSTGQPPSGRPPAGVGGR